MSDNSDEIPFELDDDVIEEENKYIAGPLSDGDKTLNERLTETGARSSMNDSFSKVDITVTKTVQN